MNTYPSPDEVSNGVTTAAVTGAKRQVMLTDNRIDSCDLFTGMREITIAHGADVYRLRLTAQNKLILTK